MADEATRGDTVRRVVIIGAGQAGAETAQRLRRGGFAGDVTLIGEEPLAPYQRPPLSKKYLSGEWDASRILVRPHAVYAQERITLVTGVRAVGVDRKNGRVHLGDGREIAYDALVLAQGARARRLTLPGAELPGVHLLRTAADVDAIRPALIREARLVVIGAGYIGLEVAAVARRLGLDVTVVEAAARPLARVTSPEVARFYIEEHTSRGVRFVLGSRPVLIKGERRVTGVALADGPEIPADLVIAGIGITPDTALAQQSGLEVQDGIITDARCRTSDPDIFAIGDCARRPVLHDEDRTVRLESVHNAVEGARVAAATILGAAPPALETPWFWSDQYDLKLQIAGLFQGYDELVIRGSCVQRAFAAFYYQAGRLIAVDAVNRPSEYLGAKTLIQTRRTVPPEILADASRPMKEVVAAAGEAH